MQPGVDIVGVGMLLEVGLGMLLEVGEVVVGRKAEVVVGRKAEVVVGRQPSHTQEPGVGKGTVGEDMLLEAEEQKGKPGSHLVGGLL